MKFKLNCTWQHDGSIVNDHTRWSLVDTLGCVHACAFLDQNAPQSQRGMRFMSYTMHTEGNDLFHTLDEAKAHAEKRLKELFADIAPAFAVDETVGTCLVCFSTNCLCDR